MSAVVPPAGFGMLGGGQLGRYSIIAARLMGYRTTVLDPDADAPAGRVADEHLVAAYDDPAALDRLAATCEVVTTEFENPPADALRRLAIDVRVAPPADAVAIAQDRGAEKRFLTDHGFVVAPYVEIDDHTVAGSTVASTGVDAPAILKTSRLGYDGKGQRSVDDGAGLSAAWQELGQVPCVLERRVPLDAELAVLVARTADGRTETYPVSENHHVDGVLDLTVVPARVGTEIADRARDLGRAVAEALEFVGLLAIELFVSDGQLVVNELAPRPHNSGHWTLDAAVTSQFEQQVRAVCGLALGAVVSTTPAVAMVNLLGDLWADGEPAWHVALADPAARLHLYGKAEARLGRKMGHLTVLGADPDDVARHAVTLRSRLTA